MCSSIAGEHSLARAPCAPKTNYTDGMTSNSPNSLAQASSAYLRSAMHQPIRWHEWGEEAFVAAQRENKPMLLDIGRCGAIGAT